MAPLYSFGTFVLADNPPAKAFPEVTVDLRAATFGTVLPFDVPFQIAGDIKATAKSIDAIFIEKRRVDDTDNWNAQRGPYEGRIYQEEKGGTQFRVTIPPLNAQRYYVFRFRQVASLTDSESKSFESDAKKTLDQFLQGVTIADITVNQAGELRKQLVASILSVTKGDSIDFSQGTIFDLKDANQTQPFIDEIHDVLSVQRRAPLALTDYATYSTRLRQWLDKVRGPGVLARLLTGLDAAETQSRKAAVGLTKLDDNGVQAVATGLADPMLTQTTKVPLSDVSDPLPVLDYITRYKSTSSALDELRSFVEEKVGTDAAPRTPPGLTPSEASDLRRMISRGGVLFEAIDDTSRLVGVTETYRRSLAGRSDALDKVAKAAAAAAVEKGVTVVNSSTTGPYDTFQSYYVSADAGLLYGPDLDDSVPYLGVNIYLRPVNKNAPLSQRGSLGRRFAFTVALTASSVADGKTREDLFGNQAMLLGVGFRVTDVIRLGFGELLFKEHDPNPLIDHLSLTVSPYVSFSFDWNIARTFAGVGKTFGGGS